MAPAIRIRTANLELSGPWPRRSPARRRPGRTIDKARTRRPQGCSTSRSPNPLSQAPMMRRMTLSPIGGIPRNRAADRREPIGNAFGKLTATRTILEEIDGEKLSAGGSNAASAHCPMRLAAASSSSTAPQRAACASLPRSHTLSWIATAAARALVGQAANNSNANSLAALSPTGPDPLAGKFLRSRFGPPTYWSIASPPSRKVSLQNGIGRAAALFFARRVFQTNLRSEFEPPLP